MGSFFTTLLLIYSSELQSVLDENRAFFETDDNFEIATTKKETTQDDVSNVTATTSRVGRNPGDQDSQQYYDDSEVYDDKTEFTVTTTKTA